MAWLKENWFQLITINLLLVIIYTLQSILSVQNEIHNGTEDIIDGIEVEIVDEVDQGILGLPKLPKI